MEIVCQDDSTQVELVEVQKQDVSIQAESTQNDSTELELSSANVSNQVEDERNVVTRVGDGLHHVSTERRQENLEVSCPAHNISGRNCDKSFKFPIGDPCDLPLLREMLEKQASFLELVNLFDFTQFTHCSKF